MVHIWFYIKGIHQPNQITQQLVGKLTILKVVNDLREKDVVFEQYEMTDEQGIASIGPVKGAWFKNSEGNILSVVQFECEVHSRIDYYEIINL